MWVSYRTPKKRKLRVTSDPYPFETPGTYEINIKLIDICGIETTKQLKISIP